MAHRVFIVIVTYNAMKWLPKTLSSIAKDLEVLVIDNNSKDETLSFIKNKYPNIKLFPQEKNLGFGRGNNLGIRYAYQKKADYVFLLNQDAYMNDNTLPNLISAHKKNKGFGILSPIHFNGSGNKFDRNFSNYMSHDFNDEFYFDSFNNSLKDIYEIPFVNAAAWLIPKNTLDVVGGFDPIFCHYGEDDNYCQRVLFHKLKIGVVSNSVIRHDREDRPKSKNISSEDILKKKERILKSKWADINKKTDKEISNHIKKLNSQIIKSILQLKFKIVKSKKNEIKLINKIVPEIINSRKINFQKGNHYIK